LAAVILRAYGVEAELVEGRNGVFDVLRDGVLVYSKRATGVFPDEAAIRAALGPAGG
jgi:predicted Rdx family selenoprotein